MGNEMKYTDGQGEAENIEAAAEETPRQPEAAQAEADETDEKADKKSGPGKHSQKIEAALAAAQLERDDFKDRYLRTFSDFNNYKKRNLSAVAIANRDGQGEVIERMLPVLDSFERALEPMEAQQDDAFVKGMFMVYRQIACAFEALGVKEIPAKGEPFDPSLHQAISMEDAADGQEAGIVTNVLQKGYMLDDKVLRHSMVTVSK
jgi:Molecular chaperone GrpE (heat shock protein)